MAKCNKLLCNISLMMSNVDSFNQQGYACHFSSNHLRLPPHSLTTSVARPSSKPCLSASSSALPNLLPSTSPQASAIQVPPQPRAQALHLYKPTNKSEYDESIAWHLAKQAFSLINKTGQLPPNLFDSPQRGCSSLCSRPKFSDAQDESRQQAVIKLVPTTEQPAPDTTVDSSSLSPPRHELLLPVFEAAAALQWKPKVSIANTVTMPPREPSEPSPSVQNFMYDPHTYMGPRAIRSKRTTTTEAAPQASEKMLPVLSHPDRCSEPPAASLTVTTAEDSAGKAQKMAKNGTTESEPLVASRLQALLSTQPDVAEKDASNKELCQRRPRRKVEKKQPEAPEVSPQIQEAKDRVKRLTLVAEVLTGVTAENSDGASLEQELLGQLQTPCSTTEKKSGRPPRPRKSSQVQQTAEASRKGEDAQGQIRETEKSKGISCKSNKRHHSLVSKEGAKKVKWKQGPSSDTKESLRAQNGRRPAPLSRKLLASIQSDEDEIQDYENPYRRLYNSKSSKKRRIHSQSTYCAASPTNSTGLISSASTTSLLSLEPEDFQKYSDAFNNFCNTYLDSDTCIGNSQHSMEKHGLRRSSSFRNWLQSKASSERKKKAGFDDNDLSSFGYCQTSSILLERKKKKKRDKGKVSPGNSEQDMNAQIDAAGRGDHILATDKSTPEEHQDDKKFESEPNLGRLKQLVASQRDSIYIENVLAKASKEASEERRKLEGGSSAAAVVWGGHWDIDGIWNTESSCEVSEGNEDVDNEDLEIWRRAQRFYYASQFEQIPFALPTTDSAKLTNRIPASEKLHGSSDMYGDIRQMENRIDGDPLQILLQYLDSHLLAKALLESMEIPVEKQQECNVTLPEKYQRELMTLPNDVRAPLASPLTLEKETETEKQQVEKATPYASPQSSRSHLGSPTSVSSIDVQELQRERDFPKDRNRMGDYKLGMSQKLELGDRNNGIKDIRLGCNDSEVSKEDSQQKKIKDDNSKLDVLLSTGEELKACLSSIYLDDLFSGKTSEDFLRFIDKSSTQKRQQNNSSCRNLKKDRIKNGVSNVFQKENKEDSDHEKHSPAESGRDDKTTLEAPPASINAEIGGSRNEEPAADNPPPADSIGESRVSTKQVDSSSSGSPKTASPPQPIELDFGSDDQSKLFNMNQTTKQGSINGSIPYLASQNAKSRTRISAMPLPFPQATPQQQPIHGLAQFAPSARIAEAHCELEPPMLNDTPAFLSQVANNDCFATSLQASLGAQENFRPPIASVVMPNVVMNQAHHHHHPGLSDQGKSGTHSNVCFQSAKSMSLMLPRASNPSRNYTEKKAANIPAETLVKKLLPSSLLDVDDEAPKYKGLVSQTLGNCRCWYEPLSLPPTKNLPPQSREEMNNNKNGHKRPGSHYIRKCLETITDAETREESALQAAEALANSSEGNNNANHIGNEKSATKQQNSHQVAIRPMRENSARPMMVLGRLQGGPAHQLEQGAQNVILKPSDPPQRNVLGSTSRQQLKVLGSTSRLYPSLAEYEMHLRQAAMQQMPPKRAQMKLVAPTSLPLTQMELLRFSQPQCFIPVDAATTSHHVATVCRPCLPTAATWYRFPAPRPLNPNAFD